MKKYNNLFLLFFLTVFSFSCEKHVIEYKTEPAGDDAQFQLHYFVPQVSGAANNITKVELNGVWINKNAPLATMNAIPSGSIGRFYVTKTGTNNIKMYKGDNMDLVYDQNIDLQSGKWNMFVYDFNKPPVVFNNGAPFKGVTTEDTGDRQWVKFYNMMFETEGVPTTLRIQYQYQYTVDNATGEKSSWINLGTPVSFGEATDWIPIPVNKTVKNSSGTARIDYQIQVVDNSGNPTGLLQVISGANMVNYTDWWNATIGRRVHHIFGGYRQTSTPRVNISQFFAL